MRDPSIGDSDGVATKSGPITLLTAMIPQGDMPVFLSGGNKSPSYNIAFNQVTLGMIWERHTSLCPELVADYNARKTSTNKTVSLILAEGADLHPGRVSGPLTYEIKR
ncbi:hypothetical protein H4R33_005791 [Dimargaris cristalligena]|nr:hypothetical protein H4R33_005791 [Dimargaris cristalligena]